MHSSLPSYAFSTRFGDVLQSGGARPEVSACVQDVLRAPLTIETPMS
jgi:hypothetical protein